MKIQDLTNKDVIHCQTQEEATLLCNELHRLGYKWNDNEIYLNNTNWSSFGKYTCYLIDGFVLSLGICKLNQYNVIPFSDIEIEEQFPEKWYLPLIDCNDKQLKELNNWRLKQPHCEYVDNILDNHQLLLSKHPDNTYYYSNNYNFKPENWAKNYQEITIKQFYKHILKKEIMTRFPFKLTVADAAKIINVACNTWKKKLSNAWAIDLICNEVTTVNEDFYKKMRKACNPKQHIILDEVFGKDSNKIDLTNPSTFNDLKIYEADGNDETSLIAIREDNELANKSFYLNSKFNWELKRDSDDILCLVPTHKTE